MAERKARIVLELKDEATAKFNAAFQNMNSAMGQSTQATKEMKKATDDASESQRKHGVSIVDIAAKLYLVQVGVRNVVRALSEIYEFGKLGATAEQVAYSFERVVTNAGGTVDMLEELRRVSKGTISDVQMMSAVNQALVGTSGDVREEMLRAIPKLLEMARASAILNPQLGDTAQQFDRLTLGLKRLEPRIIDDIGLELRLTEVNANYAKQIGKTVDSLTVEERSLALLNAVLERHGDYVKLAGENAEAAVDPYSRFEAAFDNLKNAIAERLSPAIENAITHWADFMDALTEVVKGGNIFVEAAGFIAKQIDNITEKFGGEAFALDIVNNKLREQKPIYEDTRKSLEEENYGRTEAIMAMGHQKRTLGELGDEYLKVNAKVISTLENLTLRQAQINEKRLDQERRLRDKIGDEESRLRDKLIDIHEDAERKRVDITRNATEERLKIEENYTNRVNDVNKDIAALYAELEDKNPFLSPETEGEIKRLEQESKSLAQNLKALRREQKEDPREDRAGLIAELERQEENVQESLSQIREQAREEERRNRILFRIQEKEAEIRNLAEQREIELSAVVRREQEKLSIITANEIALTQKTQEESDKRRTTLNTEFAEIAASAERDLKMATVDAFLSVADAGTALHDNLLDVKLAAMGASDAMIDRLHKVRGSIIDQDGLVVALREFGFSAQWQLHSAANSTAVLNSQLQNTVNLLNQVQANPYAYGYGGTGGGGIARRQHGGTVGNEPVLVGEAGPELFIPGRPGGVVSNNMLGGGGSTVNINISAGAFQGSRADAVQFAKWVGPLVMEYLDRNGSNTFSVGSRRMKS